MECSWWGSLWGLLGCPELAALLTGYSLSGSRELALSLTSGIPLESRPRISNRQNTGAVSGGSGVGVPTRGLMCGRDGPATVRWLLGDVLPHSSTPLVIKEELGPRACMCVGELALPTSWAAVLGRMGPCILPVQQSEAGPGGKGMDDLSI